jgi:hypothetical protein
MTGTALLVPILCLSYALPCTSEEVRFPIPAYQDEELAEVRDWERDWAGTEVDYTNVDQVADMLPEGYVRIYKNPEEWNAERYWFTIVPYEQILPSKGFIEATKKHAQVAQFDEEKDVLLTYTTEAGLPFPNPQTGREIAWNMHFQNSGETYHTEMRGATVDPSTGAERESITERWYMWFGARTERTPKPMLPKKQNKKNFRWAYVHHFYHPPETVDNRFLNIRYDDHRKHDDSYLWLAQFRRIRRYVATQKMDTIDGTDHSYEDTPEFNDHVQKQTYRLIGRKDMLAVRHGDVEQWIHEDGEVYWNGLQREQVRTYVVEAVPKDKSHIYSKRIWYVDPEIFLILFQDAYDRLGRYWRAQEWFYSGGHTSELGEPGFYFCGDHQSDQDRIQGGYSRNKLYEISPAIDPKIYTLAGLRRGGY